MTAGFTTANLTWEAVKGSTKYEILYDGEVVASAGARAKAARVNVAADGVERVFTVRAVPSGEEQQAGLMWRAISVAPPPPPPPPPTGIVPAPPQGTLAVHDGKGTQSSYEFLYQWSTPSALNGGDIGGLDIRNYTDYGLGIMSWNPDSPSVHPFTIHDCQVLRCLAGRPR